MGRLIPAGTGMARYQNIGIQIDAPPEILERIRAEEEADATAAAAAWPASPVEGAAPAGAEPGEPGPVVRAEPGESGPPVEG